MIVEINTQTPRIEKDLPLPLSETVAILPVTETSLTPREQLLFKPFPKTGDESSIDPPIADFSLLLSQAPDEELDALFADFNSRHKRIGLSDDEAFAKRGQVTKESIQAAIPTFHDIQVDPAISAAVSEYRRDHPGIFYDKDLMSALRTDGGLRGKVGRRIQELVNDYPYNIAQQESTNPTHIGYGHVPNITPKEYTAQLVLSMSDGTFKPDNQAGIDHSRLMEIENGRHRSAALGVIRNIASPPSPQQ